MTNNKNSTRYYSGRQEKAIAKAINGNLSSNSGAADFAVGDIVTKNWLIEAKTCITPKKSFSIKKDWLIKMKEEQYAGNKDFSALCFDFGDMEDRYYIIDENLFLNIKELLNHLQD